MYGSSMGRRRVTITVDALILDQAYEAVREGHCRSLGEWINEALAQRLDKDRRLAVLRKLIAEYESEHGEITDDEMAEQALQDQEAAAALRLANRRTG